jgi:hypothetical protein
MKLRLNLWIFIFTCVSCNPSPDVSSSSNREGTDPRMASEEYQAHVEQRRRLNESMSAVMLTYQEQLTQEMQSPEDQLNALWQDLSDRASPPAVREKIEEIIAQQMNESASPEEVRALCDTKLDEIEVIYPGFRAGLKEEVTIFSCVTSRRERSISRIQSALRCHVRQSSDTCMSRLSEMERQRVEQVLSSAGISHEIR